MFDNAYSRQHLGGIVMTAKLLLLVTVFSFATISIAGDKDCDSCQKAASAAKLACLQKAKTDAAKKSCEDDRKNQEQLCKLTKCRKGLF